MEARDRCDACDQSLQGAAQFSVTSTQDHVVDYARCPACGLLQMVPIPSASELAAFYDNAYYGLGETKFSGWMETIRSICLRRRARRIFPLANGAPIHVLDVGAGDGRFLKAMRDLGCRISGTELAGSAYDRASRIPDIQLLQGDVTEAGFTASTFHVVTLWHVLEHTGSPSAALRCCHGLLQQEGLLVVEVPNLGSWQSRLTGRHAFHLDPPRHLYQFEDGSLRALLESAGFEITRRETASLEMGVMGATQSWMNVLIKPRDLFYDMLRTRNRCPGGLASKTMTVLLAILLIPVATVFTLAESACGHGPVLRLFCRKAQ